MPKVAASNPRAQRLAAQRRSRREIKSGTYTRGPAGKAYEAARKRQRSGRDIGLTETPGGKGFGQRQFSSIRDAMRWGQANIASTRTRAYLTGFGRFHPEYVDQGVGKTGFRTITGYIRAMSLDSPLFQVEAESRARAIFAELKYVILRWEL